MKVKKNIISLSIPEASAVGELDRNLAPSSCSVDNFNAAMTSHMYSRILQALSIMTSSLSSDLPMFLANVIGTNFLKLARQNLDSLGL